MDKRRLNVVIKQVFGSVKNEGDLQVQVDCPKCQQRDCLLTPDGKSNLEINLELEFYKCWKCDSLNEHFSGTLKKLIKVYGSWDDYVLFKQLGGGNVVYNKTHSKGDKIDEHISEVFLPQEFIPFDSDTFRSRYTEFIQPYRYLVDERKLTEKQIRDFNLGFCVDGYYKDRIIIPSYDKFNDLNYFVARTFKKVKPVYEKPKNVITDDIILNEKNINWDFPIFLVEGYFDLFSLPLNTIPLGGTIINSALYFKLKTCKPPIILTQDPDAKKKTLKYYDQLKIIYGDKSDLIKYVDIPLQADDINKYSTDYGRNSVIELLKTMRSPIENDYYM